MDAASPMESTTDVNSYRQLCQMRLDLLRSMNSWKGKYDSNTVASTMRSELSARLVELLSSRLENKAPDLLPPLPDVGEQIRELTLWLEVFQSQLEECQIQAAALDEEYTALKSKPEWIEKQKKLLEARVSAREQTARICQAKLHGESAQSYQLLEARLLQQQN